MAYGGQNVAAVNVGRYLVPVETTCIVQGGLSMTVREGLLIDGLLVLAGLLTFEG